MARSEIVARGREEWQRKRSDRDWRGWVRIMEAVEIGRDETDKKLHNRITPGGGRKGRNKGSGWNKAFGQWLRDNGFEDLDGKKFGQLRSRMMDCIDSKQAIETWRRDLLDLSQRQAWNHPVTVWSHFAAHQKAEAARARGEDPDKKS